MSHFTDYSKFSNASSSSTEFKKSDVCCFDGSIQTQPLLLFRGIMAFIRVVDVWAGKLRTMLIFIPAGLDDILRPLLGSVTRKGIQRKVQRMPGEKIMSEDFQVGAVNYQAHSRLPGKNGINIYLFRKKQVQCIY